MFHVSRRAGVKAVLESEDFKAAGGVAVFRQNIFVVNVGVFIVLLGLLTLIPAEETIVNLLVKTGFVVGTGTTGLYLILDGLFSRVYLEPERLVYKNFCGIRKAIDWRDIRKVSTRVFDSENGMWQYLLVSGDDTKIKISWNYIAYGALRNEIKKRWKQNTTDSKKHIHRQA